MAVLKLILQLNFFVFTRMAETENSQPVFCTRAGLFSITEENPVNNGVGNATNWFPHRSRYQATCKLTRSCTNPKFTAPSSFLFDCHRKSGLGSIVGTSED